jgi:hypothetical protein
MPSAKNMPSMNLKYAKFVPSEEVLYSMLLFRLVYTKKHRLSAISNIEADFE